MPSRFSPLWALAFLALAGCAQSSLDVAAPAPNETAGQAAPAEGKAAARRMAAAVAEDPSPNGTNVLGWRATLDGEEAYLLDTGDRLRVFVYGQPNLSRLYTVDQSGRITVPLIGGVAARGLTTTQLERAIRGRLAERFVRDPQVTVDVAQNRPFFILGEVRNPGQYPYVSSMTVETAVAIAGGYTERASDKTFRISRRSGGSVVQIEVPAQYTLQPGDTVFVYERFL